MMNICWFEHAGVLIIWYMEGRVQQIIYKNSADSPRKNVRSETGIIPYCSQQGSNSNNLEFKDE